MFDEFKEILARSSGTFAEDLLGVMALALLLVGSLNLPNFV